MGAEIYADYQKALYYRGGVDFDDLIRLALDALELDQDLLARLRHRWPFILEDEAQESDDERRKEDQESLARAGQDAGEPARIAVERPHRAVAIEQAVPPSGFP